MANRRDDRYASMEELAQALVTEVEGQSFVGDNSAAIPAVSASWSGIPTSQVQASSGGNPPVPGPASGTAVTKRSATKPDLGPDKRSPWLYRGLGAFAGLFVVGLALLLMQLLTGPRNPKDTVIRPNPGTVVDKDKDKLKVPPNVVKTPVTDDPDNDPNKPKTTDPTPGTEPGEEHTPGKGEPTKLTFANSTQVRVKLVCAGQKPVTIEAAKSVLTKLSPNGTRCEATAPGYKTQVFAAAEIRKSIKKGKVKLTINLVPDKVPGLSLIKPKK
jgi:hypothetical protein